MNYNITDECIIEEFLNNWFTYDELAQYLCIDVIGVNNVLNNISDLKLQEKVNRHKKLIVDYYSYNGEEQVIDNYKDIVMIADYIIDNHSSIRETAKIFGIGKSTIYDRIHEKLPIINIKKYKEVFDILMENKSYNTNNKQVMEQVLNCYTLLKNGITSKEICDKLGIGRNVLQRNLTTRLRKIDSIKAEEVSEILREYQLQPLAHQSNKKYV